MTSEAPTHDATLAGTKIAPFDSATGKTNDAADSHSSVGDAAHIEKAHIAPLTDGHSKNLDRTIAGSDCEPKTAAQIATETAQSVGAKAAEVAGQIKDVVIDAANKAYDAAAGKK